MNQALANIPLETEIRRFHNHLLWDLDQQITIAEYMLANLRRYRENIQDFFSRPSKIFQNLNIFCFCKLYEIYLQYSSYPRNVQLFWSAASEKISTHFTISHHHSLLFEAQG